METKATHTPGPWRVQMYDWDRTHSTDVSIYGHSDSNSGKCVTRVYGEGSLHWKTDERDANARLIAAAPELLSAVKEFMEFVYPDRVETLKHTKAVTMFRAAIDKVEGKGE